MHRRPWLPSLLGACAWACAGALVACSGVDDDPGDDDAVQLPDGGSPNQTTDGSVGSVDDAGTNEDRARASGDTEEKDAHHDPSGEVDAGNRDDSDVTDIDDLTDPAHESNELSDEELERLFDADPEADGDVAVRIVELDAAEERTALLDVAQRLAEDAPLQRVEPLEPKEHSLHLDQLEVFGSSEEAKALASVHELKADFVLSPAFQLLGPARPAAFLDRPELDLTLGRAPEPEGEPGEILVLTPIVAPADDLAVTPTPPVVPLPDLGLTGPGGQTVVRHVANDDLPLLSGASFGASVELQLRRGDRVFVFDTLPVRSDGAWFVQVQLADRGGHPVGWVPLPWLYEKPVATQSGSLDFNATYGLFSKQIAGFIENTFYAACTNYPVYPQNALFSLPQYDSNVLPSARNYRCGEFPVGETYSNSHKHVTTVDFTTPGFKHDGKLFKVDIAPIPLSIPIDMLRLNGQTRGKNYNVRDLSTAWSSAGTADVSQFRLYSRFPNHERQAVFETDDAVRVHDSDFWFNVTYEPPAGVTEEADAYVNSCFYLPGGKLESQRFGTDIKLTTKSVKTRTSHITGVEFGAVEFSRFRVCTTAAVRQRSQSAPNSDGIIDHLAPNATPAPLTVHFVRGTIEDIDIRYQGQPHLYGNFDPLHNAILSTMMDVLGAVLRDGLPFSIAGKDLSGGVGPLIWQGWMKGALEQQLLNQLDVIAARFTGSLPDPKSALRRACDLIMPASYAALSSPFYPLYQQCLEATADVQVDAIVPPTLESSCYERGTFARASDGKSWTSDQDTEDLYIFSDAPGDVMTIKRPFWVNGCRVRAEAQTEAMSEWWPLLQCMADVVDRDVNYGLSPAAISANLQSQCLKPAVKMLCELYGEGDDLIGMWTGQDADFAPPGTFGFCGYYEELDREPCTPQTCLTLQ